MQASITQQDWDYWYDRVYGFFYRRINNREDVEDLTAKVLTEVFMKEDVKILKGLMWTIARRRLIDYIRAKKEGFQELDEEKSAELISTPSSHYQEKMVALLDCAKSQLKPQDYEIVEKSVLEDFKSEELEDLLSIKAATIRKRLSRSLSKVREQCKHIWFLNTQSSI